MPRHAIPHATLFVLLFAQISFADAGFRPIFDGKTLDGWKAPDMNYWTVQDGAITARGTKDRPVKTNQFLVWQQGRVDDFELKLQYRITGEPSANSGIQIRSQIQPDGHVIGYQADIDREGRYAGALYDEHGRAMLAARGQKTAIAPDGKMTHSPTADSPQALLENINQDGWNAYHIVARGPHITLRINGKITAEVTDHQTAQRELSGLLAVQIHSGPPLTVQFKDIQLKRLPLEKRKKIVLVAGPKSHGYSGHEHNAGILLLTRLLNENVPELVEAAPYLDGWPKDPTALDNANAIVIFSDGGDGGHVLKPEGFARLDPVIKSGVGLAVLHYALIAPEGNSGDYLLDWIGGYYKTNWSVNPFWTAEIKSLPDHPITRGVAPFAINDEWYYHMRFREHLQGVTPILTATPPNATRQGEDGPHSGNPTVRARLDTPEHLAWASERPADGGRGFGFTGAHPHWNWAQDDFRKLVLNALVWTAGAAVPSEGVASPTPTLAELEENQDYPQPKDFDREKIQKMLDGWK